MFQALLLEPSVGDTSDLNTLRSLPPRCLLASVLFSAPGWFSRTTSKAVSDLAGSSVIHSVSRALQKDVAASTSLPAECVRCTTFPHAHSFWQDTHKEMQQWHIFHRCLCKAKNRFSHSQKHSLPSGRQGTHLFCLSLSLFYLISPLGPWDSNVHFSHVFHPGNLEVPCQLQWLQPPTTSAIFKFLWLGLLGEQCSSPHWGISCIFLVRKRSVLEKENWQKENCSSTNSAWAHYPFVKGFTNSSWGNLLCVFVGWLIAQGVRAVFGEENLWQPWQMDTWH